MARGGSAGAAPCSANPAPPGASPEGMGCARRCFRPWPIPMASVGHTVKRASIRLGTMAGAASLAQAVRHHLAGAFSTSP